MPTDPTPEFTQIQLWPDDEMPPEVVLPTPSAESTAMEQSPLATQLHLPGLGPEEDIQ